MDLWWCEDPSNSAGQDHVGHTKEEAEARMAKGYGHTSFDDFLNDGYEPRPKPAYKITVPERIGQALLELACAVDG